MLSMLFGLLVTSPRFRSREAEHPSGSLIESHVDDVIFEELPDHTQLTQVASRLPFPPSTILWMSSWDFSG